MFLLGVVYIVSSGVFEERLLRLAKTSTGVGVPADREFTFTELQSMRGRRAKGLNPKPLNPKTLKP